MRLCLFGVSAECPSERHVCCQGCQGAQAGQSCRVRRRRHKHLRCEYSCIHVVQGLMHCALQGVNAQAARQRSLDFLSVRDLCTMVLCMMPRSCVVETISNTLCCCHH